MFIWYMHSICVFLIIVSLIFEIIYASIEPACSSMYLDYLDSEVRPDFSSETLGWAKQWSLQALMLEQLSPSPREGVLSH